MTPILYRIIGLVAVATAVSVIAAAIETVSSLHIGAIVAFPLGLCTGSVYWYLTRKRTAL